VRLTLLLEDSRVHVDVRSKGLVAALDHDITFTARPDAMAIEVAGEGPVEVALRVTFPVERIDPPEGASKLDRKMMLDNLRGGQVLDASKWPEVVFLGRYGGTLEEGSLDGGLVVRGQPRRLRVPLRVTRDGERFHARGQWEGTLGDMGLRPFKAFLGAVRLADFLRLRVDVVCAPAGD
jgi:hypothetical protein